MMILYRLSLFIYKLAIRIAALWNRKAARWISLRKTQEQALGASRPIHKEKFRIWMHVASLGEFEQGRPLVEKLKKDHPEISVWVSFFSPSGFDRVNEAFIDRKLVLPIDSPKHATAFIDLVDPDVVVFVKYEFWYFYLAEINRRGIPVIFVSAVFRESQWFFHPLFRRMKGTLQRVDRFFVQDAASKNILGKHGIPQASIAGDNRVDRVITLPETVVNFSSIKAILPTPVDLICGSIWPADAAIILPVLKNKGLSAIIAPHEISEPFVRKLKNAFEGRAILYSELNQPLINTDSDSRVLILDTVGLLSRIYRLGKCAYIGGGFGPGIHNTLEPAAYGIPVIFGPKYQKFPEAVDFIRLGAGRTVSTTDEFGAALDGFGQPEKRQQVKRDLEVFFREHSGGTEKITSYIEQRFL